MPPYTIEKLSGEPIVIITTREGYDPSHHVGEAAEKVNELLDKLDNAVVFIQDLSSIKVDMDDIMVAADTTGRGSQAPFHHVNIRQLITVTQDPILKQSFAGMAGDMYGNLKMVIFDTLDEALDYARHKLA